MQRKQLQSGDAQVRGLEGHWLEKRTSERWDESVELKRNPWELTELPR